MILIGISGKRRSGKSTLGEALRQEYNYFPVSLAAPLKALCQQHFGLTVDQTDGQFKEQPTQFKKSVTRDIGFGFVQDVERAWTPRDIMIHIGKSYRSVDPDFWCKKLFEQIRTQEQAQLGKFVITDIRFRNECDWVKRHGGKLIRLERDEEFTGPNINDPSEMELDDYEGFDLKIPSSANRTMSDIYTSADLIEELIVTK